MCDHWRDMVRIPTDIECAQVIANDNIDIIIDLGGHTYDGLKALAYSPALIQATYLGYPNTTGLCSIDYRITDSICDSEDQDKYYSESLYRLKSGFLAFAPPIDAPIIKAAPCLENGYITFGSFNNFAKVTEKCIDMWCKILKRVDNSRMIIKSKLFNEQGFKDEIISAFETRGIDEYRVDLVGHIESLNGHLDLYNSVDIALDTYPYNGTTTTCEALWMGVPVVSMYGTDHRSRVGLSILSQIGLPSLAAENERAYMKNSIKLAANHDQLSSMRMSLRNAISNSSICDAFTTTRELEDAYSKWTDQ